MTFQGWPEAALDFYEDLEDDNSRSFWMAHKAVYESAVLAPMTELADELSDEFGEVKIFRPNRDVRFSADKSPYKTQIGATIGTGYVQLSARGLAAGNGMYMLAPDQLDRYRQAVAHDITGAELERIVAAVTGDGITITSHDSLKTAPRGYPPDHPRIDLLRHKGLIAWRQWPVAPWLSTAAAKDHVEEFLLRTRPLATWLADRVGPAAEPDARRPRRR